MASYINKSTPMKRQRPWSGLEDSSKRQRISEAEVRKPQRKSPQPKAASIERPFAASSQRLNKAAPVDSNPETSSAATGHQLSNLLRQSAQRENRIRDPEESPISKPPAKRSLHDENPAAYTDRISELSDQDKSRRKRTKRSIPSPRKSTTEGALDREQDPISHWVTKSTWPVAYFKGDEMHHHLLARKGSSASLRRKRSNSSVASDERPRDEKSAPYRNPSYHTFLSEDVDNYKSYMEDHTSGVSSASETLLQVLLHSAQTPPNQTIFREDVFRKHLRKLKGKNESRILQDLSNLLVPSAEVLASLGANHLNSIVESVNEGWNCCRPVTKPRPQPDSAFGFGASSFSAQQLDKLRPALGDATFSSYFKATYYMHFPFMAKGVKTGTMGLDIADNQNAHSMTVAVRAVVELFKLVGRERELHREIVAFAISHDADSVRLYAYYPFIDGDKVTIWRRIVDRFYLDIATMWRSWTFTMNVYDIFSPLHLRRIRSAIDDISPLNFLQNQEIQNSEPPLQPGTTSESSGLLQQLEQHRVDKDVEIPEGQPVTPSTSVQSNRKSPQRRRIGLRMQLVKQARKVTEALRIVWCSAKLDVFRSPIGRLVRPNTH